MPSGAKKRKAAKKKKENEANTNSQGNELQTHDERESDGGEVSSPASQDHNNHHHPFIEEEKEEKRDTSSARSFVAENNSMEGLPNNGEGTQKIVAEDEGIVEIVRELKSDRDSESKTISIEYVESAKESHDGSSSSSSSEESQVVEKNSFLAENNSMEGLPNDGEGTQKIVAEDEGVIEIVRELKSDKDSESKTISIEYVESVKESHDGSSSSSSSDDELRVVEKNSVVAESVKTKEEAYNPVSETAPFDVSVKPVVSLSEEVTRITEDAPVGENCNSVVETIPVVDLVKPVVSLSEEVIHVTKSVPVENSVNSDMAELGTKENVEKLLPSLDENTGVSLAVIDLVSKKNEDIVFPLSDENAGTSSSAMGLASKENKEKLLQSSNAPSIETRNGAEHIKDSEIPESSENQPLVASAPRPVETTSWKSCCGLFEVLTGSNR